MEGIIVRESSGLHSFFANDVVLSSMAISSTQTHPDSSSYCVSVFNGVRTTRTEERHPRCCDMSCDEHLQGVLIVRGRRGDTQHEELIADNGWTGGTGLHG